LRFRPSKVGAGLARDFCFRTRARPAPTTTAREALIKSFDKLRMNGNLLISFVVDCMDAGGRAPTLGALGDAGAVAESLSNHEQNRFVQHFPS